MSAKRVFNFFNIDVTRVGVRILGDALFREWERAGGRLLRIRLLVLWKSIESVDTVPGILLIVTFSAESV